MVAIWIKFRRVSGYRMFDILTLVRWSGCEVWIDVYRGEDRFPSKKCNSVFVNNKWLKLKKNYEEPTRSKLINSQRNWLLTEDELMNKFRCLLKIFILKFFPCICAYMYIVLNVKFKWTDSAHFMVFTIWQFTL